MDFLDNAVAKAKDVFDIACKKTEEAVNTGKTKIDIAALENKMAKDFEKLGRLYFEALTDNEGLDDATLKLKTAIEAKQAKIKELREELED